jgi:V/A-type H+-transporting ATPase subunit C
MEEIHWKYGNDVRYAYAVGVVRVLETRTLSRDRIDRAADASSVEEVLRILGETTYSEYLSDLKTPADYESFLDREHQKTLDLLETLTEDPTLTDLLLYRFDYHNLKVALKERFGEENLATAYVPFGRVSVTAIKAAVMEEDFSSLPDWLTEAAREATREFPERQDPKWIDFLVDRKMYELFIARSRREGSLFLYDLTQKEIDLINILSLFRIRLAQQERGRFMESFVEGGALSLAFFVGLFDETLEAIPSRFAYTAYRDVVESGWDHVNSQGSFVVFERMGRELLLEHARKANLIAFGIEPLIAYVHAKENELRMIRTIMVGKLNNLPANLIKEGLPRVYL